MNKKTSTKSKKESSLKLPRYLRLEKGTMWFDTEGEDASGVRIYSMQKKMTSRELKMKTVISKTGEETRVPINTDVPRDENDNKNVLDYGKVENDLPWYIDTKDIPTEKLSRILLAYKHGILIEADPDNPITPNNEEPKKNFKINSQGDRVFAGKNVSMYQKLQNMNFKDLSLFISNCPRTANARNNLQDLYHYEQSGYNPLSRPRHEVLELIKDKLREYGNGISPIRINED